MWILGNQTKKICVKRCPVEWNHSHQGFRNRTSTPHAHNYAQRVRGAHKKRYKQ